LEIYDPLSNTWSTGAPMPNGVSGAVGAAINGKFYVAGGASVNETPALAILQIYDPATDTWSSGAPMSTPHYGGVGGVIDGKFYVTGGWTPTGGLNATLEIYDPVSNTWTTGTPEPTPLALSVGAVINSKLFVAGGYIPVTNGRLEVYTPDACAMLEQQLAAANAQIAQLQADKTALINQVNTLTAQNTALASQLAQCQSDLTTANAANQALQAQNAVLLAANAQLQTEVTTLAAQNNALTAQLNVSQAQINTLGANLGAAFNNPGFRIRGGNLSQQLQALSAAIGNLNHGQQQALFFNLGGTKK
jgi:N-acetylneuraminic acid mutarotase